MRLYATDLSGHTLRRARSWDRWQDVPRPGPGSETDLQPVSDVVGHEGRLWYLEERESARRTQLWLASVDPGTGRYHSTPLDRPQPSSDSVTVGGHLYAGRLYAVVGGDIVAVDLGTRSLKVVGRLSRDVRRIAAPIVSWREGTLSVLAFLDDHRTARWETYDLRSGSRTRSVDVPGLAELERQGAVTLTSFTTR